MDKEEEKEKTTTKCFEVEKPMDHGKCLIADQRQPRPKLAVGDLSRKLAGATDPRKAQMLERPGIPEMVGSEMGLNKEIRQQFMKNFVHPCS